MEYLSIRMAQKSQRKRRHKGVYLYEKELLVGLCALFNNSDDLFYLAELQIKAGEILKKEGFPLNEYEKYRKAKSSAVRH